MLAADIATFMCSVQMPTVQHLLTASLEPARAAIEATLPEKDPQKWVALNMILGTALRLRTPRMPPHERANSCLEAVRAFEGALAVCCESRNPRALRCLEFEGAGLGLQPGGYAPGPDGVQLIVDATTVPLMESIPLLERAIPVLEEVAHETDRRSQLREWLIARSNLGCALTMLGQRTPGEDGAAYIEEAIETLVEAASACPTGELLTERASIYVNLSESFHALAERTTPGERQRYLEQSLDWIAAALGFYAPAKYRWLLELDRVTVA